MKILKPLYISKIKMKKSLRYFFYTILIVIFYFIIKEAFGFETPNFEKNKPQNKFLFIIESLLIIPILEELLTRCYLNLKLRNLIISFLTCIILYIIAIIKDYDFLLISLPFLFIYLLLLIFLVKINSLNTKNYNKNLIVFLGAIFFAILHLNKINDLNYYNLLVYIGLIPSFIIGIGLGYVRLKLGLIYSIFLHSLYNLPANLILFFN